MGGFNRSEVNAYLESLASDLAALRDERDRLATRLAQTGEQDFDFDALSHEIGQILTAAKDAADGLRSRAEEDVSRWRNEAQAEVSQQRTQAALDAEAMRADAWSVGTQLLTQAQLLAEALEQEARDYKAEILAETEREALALTGQSERDAHRLQASARRESEEMLRLAKMESERLQVEARAEHELILESANASAEAAQERARALEVRRNEMLTELESVRATVAKVESDLEEKRVSLEAAAPEPEPEPESEELSGVRIVPAEPEVEQAWPDSAVKLIPAQKPELTTDGVDADAIVDEVRRMKTATEAAHQAKAVAKDLAVQATQEEEARVAVDRADDERRIDEDATSDEADEPSDDVIEADEADNLESEQILAPEQEQVVASAADAAPTDEALDGLFASLRTGESPVVAATNLDTPRTDAASDVDVLSDAERVSVPVRLDIDPFELADHLLLPITNRILRSVKRQLTEAQNIALEGIRVDESDWEPGTGDLAADLHGDFVILAQESFAAGYSATETMTGKSLGRAKPESGDIIDHSQPFASGLADALSEAFHPSEEVRALSSAASRVFRVWRTDEAERQIRHHARDAYHRGISRALKTAGIESMFIRAGGRGCSDCRTAVERGSESTGGDFAGVMPPLHDGCSCTVVPGS